MSKKQEPKQDDDKLSRLVSYFDEKEKYCKTICLRNDEFSKLLSILNDFYPQLINIYENILSIDGGKNTNLSGIYQNDFAQISNFIASFVLTKVSQTILDETTFSNFKTAQTEFSQILSIQIPFFLSPFKSTTFNINKVLKTGDVTSYVRINQSNPEHKLESLQQFNNIIMQSLTKLTYKLSTLQGDASQFITYTKYPSPSLIKDYPDFKNELQTNSEHQKSLENAILTISPQIVKLKEQQLQISNLSKLHFSTYSDLQQTHSTLTECLKENCTAELEFLKLKLIKQAEQDYEFFNYESFTQKIISFHETESKLIESLGQDITSEQLSSYLEELQRLCNQFDYDNDQLTKKVAVKTRTEETFTEKYPKTNSEPPQRLLKSRERCKALEKKYKNQIEYLKNGFDRLTEKCAQISDESNSMFLLYDSLENSSKITEFFASSSSMDWLDSIILHLKTEIEKKKKELNDIKNQIENIRKGIVANNSNICHHQKDVCICNCGHTFCKNCIDNYVKENGENCPICKSHFAPDELIQIVW